MLRIEARPLAATAALEPVWRDLETRAEPSFFQSWTWIGCPAAARFDRPVVVEARRDGVVVALALFNRRRRTLFLGETGRAAWDAVFVEHNGILVARDDPDPAGLRAACLRAIGQRRLVLSGVDDRHLDAARAMPGLTRLRQTRRAPRVDFARLGHGAYLDTLSPNTRYQIRRSDRRYAASGPLAVERASSVPQARQFLHELAVLHQRTWQSRGRPGAFANPVFVQFHEALIERAVPERSVDLLRFTAGEQLVGVLYNFVWRNCVSAYQSGFAYDDAGAHEKPGLTSHRLAVEMYRDEGRSVYDFLAGDDRYKTSLANASTVMHWLDYVPRFTPGWVAAGVRSAARRLRDQTGRRAPTG